MKKNPTMWMMFVLGMATAFALAAIYIQRDTPYYENIIKQDPYYKKGYSDGYDKAIQDCINGK